MVLVQGNKVMIMEYIEKPRQVKTQSWQFEIYQVSTPRQSHVLAYPWKFRKSIQASLGQTGHTVQGDSSKCPETIEKTGWKCVL